MADTRGRHPFQINILPGTDVPYKVTYTKEGCYARRDMPGVAANRFKGEKKGDKKMITFSGEAPKKQGFPYDESERTYAGYVKLTKNPIPIAVPISICHGSVFIAIFHKRVRAIVSSLSLPRFSPLQSSSGSVKSDKAEGSSFEKLVDKAQHMIHKTHLEELQKTEQPEGSSSGKGAEKDEDILHDLLALVSAEGTSARKPEASTEQSGHSSSDGSDEEWTAIFEQILHIDEGRSEEPIFKTESPGKPRLHKVSALEDDEAWMQSYLRKHFLLALQPESQTEPKPEQPEAEFVVPMETSSAELTRRELSETLNSVRFGSFLSENEESEIEESIRPGDSSSMSDYESAHVKTSPIQESSNGRPEVTIGSLDKYECHGLQCQCNKCDSQGICLKTWCTTADRIGPSNPLKIKGPDGACEKRMIQKDGLYSLYVRTDVPGLASECCEITLLDRCIMVWGKLAPPSADNLGPKSYLFFVQLRCLCCKFDNLQKSLEDGVLRLFCDIVESEPPGPSADS